MNKKTTQEEWKGKVRNDSSKLIQKTSKQVEKLKNEEWAKNIKHQSAKVIQKTSEDIDKLKKQDNIHTDEEKFYSMMSYLLALTAIFIPFTNIILPVIIWFVKGSKSDYIERHGQDSINININFTILLVALIALTYIGLPVYVIYAYMTIFFVFIAIWSLKAYTGKIFKPWPLLIKWVK